MASMKRIGVGDEAPDFTKVDQKGETIQLSALRGEKVVVLYFYPKDDTPGCTAEACSFRDSYEDFVDLGAAVIGVSSDSENSHRAFAERHGLPFHLVSDGDGALRKAYGIPKMFLMPGRSTLVIDKEGVVRHVFDAQIRATKHVDEALEAVRKLIG